MVFAWSAWVPTAVLLSPPDVLARPLSRPIKTLLVEPEDLTSRVVTLALLLTVKTGALIVVSCLTEIAEITPLKLVVGVNIKAPVVVVLMMTVWVALSPRAGAETPPMDGVTVLVTVELEATVNTTW